MTAPFSMKPLPYADDALSPVVNPGTIGFHYGKHHTTYLNNLNKFASEDASLQGKSLEQIIQDSAGKADKVAIFNNAAQVWNHDFYWDSLAPKAGGQPSGRIADLIKDSFGDYAKFKADFAAAAVGQFGAGWAWLCLENGKLTIRKTPNAETPLTVAGVKPLLTIDVWEHAYYLDWQNRRPDYANAVIDQLLNWDFAEKNLG
ncbi:superoxide dismutase [Ferrovibrio sp.]|uniref:superoxide dismutase n=1 Tax=Ferrovibrio sp. TaxID=1917215 RepID=UPI001B725380|nr:superoxide dismutase [Ferrovibrio sp.]MBP7064396.1 superoxide dismutase [Ferrovibrio sp.]